MQSFISGLLILFQLVYMFIQCRYFDSCSFVANFEIFEKCESSILFFFFQDGLGYSESLPFAYEWWLMSVRYRIPLPGSFDLGTPH